MTFEAAQALAEALLLEHGLSQQGWHFRWFGRKRTFGLCDYTNRILYLSAPLTARNEEAAVRDTLLHEIAHALAGWRAGHGPEWQKVARRIGATPKRCFDTSSVSMPPAPYRLVCASCGAAQPRWRKTRKRWACRDCCTRYNGGRYSERFALELRPAQEP
jgi:predicted SprT family Zn-dependent metalloprotease